VIRVLELVLSSIKHSVAFFFFLLMICLALVLPMIAIGICEALGVGTIGYN
jgi:hypothetical protein